MKWCAILLNSIYILKKKCREGLGTGYGCTIRDGLKNKDLVMSAKIYICFRGRASYYNLMKDYKDIFSLKFIRNSELGS